MKELSLLEMQQIVGGISRTEYCELLVKMLYDAMERDDCDNYERIDGAFSTHCK